MKLWGVTEDQLATIVKHVSETSYEGNICVGEGSQGSWSVRGQRVKVVSFTLRVESSKGPGHRVSASAFSTRRRMVAACWHVHRDVMAAIFAAFPDARIKSAMADYRGKASFESQFEATGAMNIGSIAYPVLAREACDCHGEFQPPVFDSATAFAGTAFAK